jgi:hypothetical protein
MFPRCPVPVYLLPTGSQAGDFYLAFAFDDLMDDLRSGVLVRPAIEVWTGRSDFDRDYLAEHLREEFVRQFDDARATMRQAFEEELESIDSRRQRAKDKAAEPVGWLAGAGVGNALFDPTGVGASILLFLALFKGKKIVAPLMEYLDLTNQRGAREKDMNRQLDELDKRFERKNKPFRRAVDALDVTLHPELRELVRMFCEVDHVLHVPIDLDEESNAPPGIAEFLSLPDYLAAVPAVYRPLLESMDSRRS